MTDRKPPVCEGCGRSVSTKTYNAFGGADQCPSLIFIDRPYPVENVESDPRDQWVADK